MQEVARDDEHLKNTGLYCGKYVFQLGLWTTRPAK
jgi:hypothetical protein